METTSRRFLGAVAVEPEMIAALEQTAVDIIDAQNLLTEVKFLNEALYMAASGIADQKQMNAMSTVANIISEKLAGANEMLDAIRQGLKP